MTMSGKRLLEKPHFELAAKNVPVFKSSGRAFQVFGPATGKARLPRVDVLLTTIRMFFSSQPRVEKFDRYK